MPSYIASFLITIINIVLSIAGFFLGLRIILRLFSANVTTPFVSWVYSISDFFLAPFRGIFPNLGIQTGVLDMVATIALIGYVLLGYLLIEIIRNLTRPVLEDVSTTHYHEIDKEEKEEEETDHHHPKHHSK